jgi:hypothetical protein
MFRSCSLAALLTILAAVGTVATGEDPAGAAKAVPVRPHLEFRIVANTEDDGPAIKAAGAYFDAARTDPARKTTLRQRGSDRLPPEPLKAAREGVPGHSWAEIGPSQLLLLRLDDASEKGPDNHAWKAAAEARDKGDPVVLTTGLRNCVVWSRAYTPAKRPGGKEAEGKRFEYFVLLRDPEPGKAVTGKHLAEVKPGLTDDEQRCVVFKLTKEGGELMHDLTSRNTDRAMAIVVDGVVISAPTIASALQTHGRIVGVFSQDDVEQLVAKLRADIAPPPK